jgi:vacuolar-type H+-ATPase subunit E/Vma4
MVMFIKQEAEEKANEIRMSAEEVWSRLPLAHSAQLS